MLKKCFSWFSFVFALSLVMYGNAYSNTETPPSAYPGEWNVIFHPSQTPEVPPAAYEKITLAAGTVFFEDTKPLPCDIIWEKDIPITLRDGTTIYADVFRPADNLTNLPAIVNWSPYGKSAPNPPIPVHPAEWVSGLMKYEGADAAYWCNNGYAVVNPDSRGANNSEGKIHFWGSVDAADGYDVIEWIAAQEWSNTKVGLYGSSWLGTSQWFIAETQPPHLAAMAPWEAFTDVYRDHVAVGGIPDFGFIDAVGSNHKGWNVTESPAAMIQQYPFMNDYWEDKVVEVENIHVPTYAVASYYLHKHLDAFRRLGSEEKWLRVHNSFEWVDQYDPANVEDVRCFFDYYLKGIQNDWQQTPKVRMAVYNFGGEDEVDRPAEEWPLPDTTYKKYYLNAATGKLSQFNPLRSSSVSYRSKRKRGKATFTLRFNSDTDMIGFLKLRLWVEADGNDDMDLFVLVQKLNARGKDIRGASFPGNPRGYVGPEGRLRVSLRELDADKSTDFIPFQTFRNPQPLNPGEIVPVDIRIWPTGMKFNAGEQLKLTVAGHPLAPMRFIGMNVPPPETLNAGRHIIHTGGRKYKSYLQIPVVKQDRRR
ncbi:MAG: CocE/NonD family hydrolase [Desulfatitalea sp.]|nr:CocE/NonD family hydrolase [Desulfatitalea sp.]NNK00774.1 CocE/NonD family hydrolase [Desulfatitalea sp.]